MNKLPFNKQSPCRSLLTDSLVRHDEPVLGAQIVVDCLGVPTHEFCEEDIAGENLDSKNQCDGKCVKSYREDCMANIE